MGSSSLVQQKYRKCLERDFRRGHSGVCTDLALREWLRQHLLADPELHYALRNDVFATLASSLRGWDALPLALRGLARAFEVLELAAVNLHLLPWRKEFSTIKVSIGVWSWRRLAAPLSLLGMLDRDGAAETVCRGHSEQITEEREGHSRDFSTDSLGCKFPRGIEYSGQSLV
ncbi:hypothetical protein KIL84_005511 [Mauremys mutica]|uniref:Spermatogenesis-associated protein 2 PUB-like domain-containing protein n=1 Tax=Mauremys mutica TaxID=74926 RepID=A0A9D4B661_9SAUR|nr:hypothetical protein KIL84_005511 [Mauremys mutica]